MNGADDVWGQKLVNESVIRDSVPQKKVSTEQYEYVRNLEEKCRLNEKILKKEVEDELKVFRTLRLRKAIEKRSINSIDNSSYGKKILAGSILSKIKIKPKV